MVMDRLRRSFRDSFRRRRDKIYGTNTAHQWHSDEIAVRQGSCLFPVKYLGCIEVHESRGMPICEEALKILRLTKEKNATRGTLLVSGDGLRVIEGDTRGLIVDQTIEKVSFCAPDRNHERGFAYICRDGTTRRWMCHGFHAVGNSGERLSHAVGRAFAICLERKQKRDQEATSLANPGASNQVSSTHLNQQNSTIKSQIIPATAQPSSSRPSIELVMTMNQVKPVFSTPPPQSKNPDNLKTSNFVKSCSFRHSSITDRRRDPQTCKLSEPPPVRQVINPYAIDRPHATPLMLQRQTSFRPLSNLKSQSPFKRQLS